MEDVLKVARGTHGRRANSEKDMSTPSDLGVLVTNTELATPSRTFSRLKAPSLLAFDEFTKIQKRYVLQSISKEMLGACSYEKGIGRSKFYRLGACNQLSAEFRPDTSIDYYTVGSGRGGQFFDDLRSIQHHRAALIKAKVGDNGIEVHLAGLCHCSSVWLCPVCFPKISQYRSQEIAYGLHRWQSGDIDLLEGSQGWVLFVTFTVRHNKSHALLDTVSCLNDSLRKTRSGKSWDNFKKRIGYVGYIKTLEYTYTEKNGHHPHRHEVWFLSKKPDVKDIKDFVYPRYSRFVEKHDGYYAPSYKRGVDIKIALTAKQKKNVINDLDLDDLSAISDYMSKGSDVDRTASEYLSTRDWGIPEEMTKANYKKAKTYLDGSKVVSYNPIQILLEYMQAQYLVDVSVNEKQRLLNLSEMSKFKFIYNEYALGTFGKSQLYWSPKLKELLGVFDLDDDILIDEHDDELREICVLDLPRLQKVIKMRIRGDVLKVASDPLLLTDKDREKAIFYFIDNYSFRVNRFG